MTSKQKVNGFGYDFEILFNILDEIRECLNFEIINK